MRINRKLIKQYQKESRIVTMRKGSYQKYDYYDFDKITKFTIIITFSHTKIKSLQDCLHYLNQCDGISLCEVLLVLYENEYFEYDFSKYKNLNYKIIHSKRNNPDNIFCLSHARNIGMVNASNDWVLMLDCDIFVPPNMCRVLSHDKMRIDSNIYCTTRVNIPSHENYSNLDVLYNKKIRIDNGFVGFFHFFNRKAIMSLIGGYDEKFIGYGREDCDLISRAQTMKMRVIYINRHLLVYHIIHMYTSDWLFDGSDQQNHYLQDLNLRNNLIKKEKIGIIIK